MTLWKEVVGKKPLHLNWVGTNPIPDILKHQWGPQGQIGSESVCRHSGRVGNKDQQKTKRYCTDCRTSYRSWTFLTAAFHERKQLLQTAEDASNLPRSLKCSSLSQIQLSYSNLLLAIIMLCGRSEDPSKFIKRDKLATMVKMKECSWSHYWCWRKKIFLKENGCKYRASDKRAF